MIDSILRLAADNLAYAEALVADIEDKHMAEQPNGIKNHPAWMLGHLSVSQDFILQLLELPSGLEPSWLRLFASGGAPTDDRLNFPTKPELLAVLKSQHEKAAAAVKANFEKRAGAATPFPPLASRFPTIGDLVLHLLTTHEAVHLGQLTSWRRVKELPPVTLVIEATDKAVDKAAEKTAEKAENADEKPTDKPAA